VLRVRSVCVDLLAGSLHTLKRPGLNRVTMHACSCIALAHDAWMQTPRPSKDADLLEDPRPKFILHVVGLLSQDRSLLHENEEEKVSYANTAKTILQWLTFAFNEGCSETVTAYLLQILPLLFSLPETSEDVELHNLCSQTLGLMSQTLVSEDRVGNMMQALVLGAQSSSWHARRRVLLFVQVSGSCPRLCWITRIISCMGIFFYLKLKAGGEWGEKAGTEAGEKAVGGGRGVWLYYRLIRQQYRALP